MCAIYAFMRTPTTSRDDGGEDAPRGRGWRPGDAALDRAFEGDYGDSRILPAFHDTARRYGIPTRYFDDLIDGAEMDLEPRRYRDIRGALPLLLPRRLGGRARLHPRLRLPRPPGEGDWRRQAASPSSSPTSSATCERTPRWAASTCRRRTCDASATPRRIWRACQRRLSPAYALRGGAGARILRQGGPAGGADRPGQPALPAGDAARFTTASWTASSPRTTTSSPAGPASPPGRSC